MSHPHLRALLVALLAPLLLAACDDGGLTAPETAAPDVLGALLDEQVGAADAEAVADAPTIAARAGVAVTPITGPTTITAPGVYELANDFSLPSGTAADAIVVMVSNVFLDLGGYTITGPGNKLGRGVVVQGAHRVVVRGGTIETFGTGVELNGSERTGVAGVRVVGGDEFADPPNGVPPQVGFLVLNSKHNRLLGNSAIETNLGFFVRGPGSRRNELAGNIAEGGEFGLLGICYNPAPDTTDLGGPSEDRVTHNFLNGFDTGIQVSEGSARNRFTYNLIYFKGAPWEDLNGTNVFRNNVTMQITA